MNQIAVELDNKLRSLDPARARNLESLVRDAMVQVDREVATGLGTDDRKNSLARLIGVWETDNPPTDEEVDSMLDQQRMPKYS